MTKIHHSHQNHQKRRAALGGSIALLAVLGAGGVTMNQAFADTSEPGVTSSGTQAGSTDGELARDLSGDTAPASPRSATAALRAAVSDVADGTASDFGGSALGDLAAQHASGRLTFTPTDGSPAGGVEVQLWDAEIMGQDFDCNRYLEDCEVTTLSDGSQLRTYTMRGTTPSAADGSTQAVVTRYAERLVGDVLVKVSADNAEDLVGGGPVTRDDAVLSIDQLAEVASQPWWGIDLPKEFAEAGEALAPFDDSNPLLWQG